MAYHELLWPDCVAGSVFEVFDTEDFAVVNDIVPQDKIIILEVNNEDLEKLVEEHKNELSMKKTETITGATAKGACGGNFCQVR